MNIGNQSQTLIDSSSGVNNHADNSQELISRLVTDNLDIWTTANKKRSATGRGSNKKIELTGIKKLRELILELAVRGKLVPQDPNDEPASVLLENIAAEKAQLIKDKKIKKPKVLPEIGDDEKPFESPSGWEWIRFGNIAQHNSGKTLDKGRNSGKPYPYLTTSNLYWGRFDLKNVREMLIEDEQLEKCTVKKNDLLICEGGEAGRAAVWERDEGICFQNHIHRARFFSEISPFFMFRFFEQLTATGEINNHRKGVGISNMSGKSLALIITPLPPLAEQHRIVAKVDELMLLCDQLEQQTEDSITAHQTLVETLLATLSNSENPAVFNQNWIRIAAHFDTLFTTEHSIDQLKQTILQLAVMGKLVPQNPNDEPASVLLEKIAAEKEQLIKDKKIKKQKPLPAITEDEKPFALPNGWECIRLGLIINLISGQHLKPEEYISYQDEGCIAYITGPAEFGDISPSYSKYTIHHRAVAHKNNILVTCKGSGIGKLNIANEKIAISRQLMAIQSICTSHLYLKLIISSLYQYFQNKGVGIAIPGISREDITEVLIGLPPLAEQQRIVSKVEELMILCDQLKARLNDAQTTQLHLADSIVEQAVN